MGRVLRIVGWSLGFVALLMLAVPSIAYGPMVVRCTQTAERWLAQADVSLNPPPSLLLEAMRTELKGRHPANLVTRDLILRNGCSGWTPERGHDHMIDEVVMMLPLRAWFTPEQLLTIFMSRAYMGSDSDTRQNVYGFDKAARKYYGRDIGDLEEANLVCLVRKSRAPRRYPCNGQ